MKAGSPQSAIVNEFLHFAAEVVQDTMSTEGTLRSAISRSYYAIYLTVREQLFGPDGVRLKSGIRKRLQKKFKMQRKREAGSHDVIIFAITDTKIAGLLKPLTLSQQIEQLKEARVHADYHFTLDNLKVISANTWREYAEENITLASYLLPMVRKLPSY